MNPLKTFSPFVIPIILLTCLFSSCKKTPFYGEGCSEDCYILSGYIYDDSTALPANNVAVELRGTEGIFSKSVNKTHTNDSGYWKMSFDANYIEDLSDGKLEYRKNSYLWRNENVSFSSADINNEKFHAATIHKAANLYYDMLIWNPDAKRIRAKFKFKGEKYTMDLSTGSDKPLKTVIRIPIPAYYNVSVGLYSSSSSSQGASDWSFIEGSIVNTNLGFMETDTVNIIF
jgi:5-hydroxyisourate hydrolase-like protein (transthyretin family)